VAYVPIRNWAGREQKIAYNGYVLIKVPEHPKSFRGWYYEHRLALEALYGRVLETWEEVHHISEDKTDNNPEFNLFPCVRCQHDRARVS